MLLELVVLYCVFMWFIQLFFNNEKQQLNTPTLCSYVANLEKKNNSHIIIITNKDIQNKLKSSSNISDYIKNKIITCDAIEFLKWCNMYDNKNQTLDVIIYSNNEFEELEDIGYIQQVLLKYNKVNIYLPYISSDLTGLLVLSGDVIFMNEFSVVKTFVGVDSNCDHYNNDILSKLTITCNKKKLNKEEVIKEFLPGKYVFSQNLFKDDLVKMGLKVEKMPLIINLITNEINHIQNK